MLTFNLEDIDTMEDKLIRTINQSTRRDILKKAGTFVIPTLITYQMTTLRVNASGTETTSGILDLPKGRPITAGSFDLPKGRPKL